MAIAAKKSLAKLSARMPDPTVQLKGRKKNADEAPAQSRVKERNAGNDKHSLKIDAAPKVKSKLVRDSFTIPNAEYEVLGLLKLRAVNLKRPAKKSELLRAGIALLQTLSDTAFLAALNKIPSLQTGRPKAGG